MTFIDGYSRKTWIYFIDDYSETRRKIQVSRTNNGGEYTSNEFLEYCSIEGIKKEHIVPHTPQRNGVAERKNRTMVGATKAMLFDQ